MYRKQARRVPERKPCATQARRRWRRSSRRALRRPSDSYSSGSAPQIALQQYPHASISSANPPMSGSKRWSHAPSIRGHRFTSLVRPWNLSGDSFPSFSPNQICYDKTFMGFLFDDFRLGIWEVNDANASSTLFENRVGGDRRNFHL